MLNQTKMATCPTPYELGGPNELVSMLEGIGFVDAKEVRLTGNYVAHSVEDYLDMFLEGSPLGHSLSEEAEEVKRIVIEKAKVNISRYLVPGKGVAIPGECVIVCASK